MGSRELGNPLGNPFGLPRKVGGGLKAINPTIVDFINGASGTYTIPDGFSFFRVTTVGAGGSGSVTVGNSGGGGGLARTDILPVVQGLAITYSAAAIPATNSDGTASTASFGTVSLTGNGGKVSGAGGTGIGGDFNFTGGSGVNAGGGGAAGPNSNGGDGAAINTNNPGGNSTDGGGGGVASLSTSRGGGGGGGVMADGGALYNSPLTAPGGVGGRYWGSAGLTQSTISGGNGGNWGGGGGCRAVGASGGTGSVGGYGGVRIELW